jgi:hypothetical protein
MSYELIFWGNSTHSDDIFKLQKRILRVIMGPELETPEENYSEF